MVPQGEIESQLQLMEWTHVLTPGFPSLDAHSRVSPGMTRRVNRDFRARLPVKPL